MLHYCDDQQLSRCQQSHCQQGTSWNKDKNMLLRCMPTEALSNKAGHRLGSTGDQSKQNQLMCTGSGIMKYINGSASNEERRTGKGWWKALFLPPSRYTNPKFDATGKVAQLWVSHHGLNTVHWEPHSLLMAVNAECRKCRFHKKQDF